METFLVLPSIFKGGPLEESDVVNIPGDSVTVDFSTLDSENRVGYFSAPQEYLGNKIKSYGGELKYTLLFMAGEKQGKY